MNLPAVCAVRAVSPRGANREVFDDPGNTAAPSDGGCLLCGWQSSKVVWRENGYEGRVTPCGLVYVNVGRGREPFQERRELHDEAYYSARNAAARVDFIQRFFGKGRLLEVGCGAGHLLVEARRRGFEVAGVEADAGCADHVRRTYDIEVETASIEDVSPPTRGFDVVFHVDLMSHFPDPIQALRVMSAQLNPSGYVCFEVGILGGISPLWYRAMGRLDFPDHRWLFSEEALGAIVRGAGLEVVEVRRFGLLASLALIGLRRAFRSFARRPSGARSRVIQGAGGQSAAQRLSAYLQFITRYRVGRWMPRIGPLTLFVAARPRSPVSAG